MRVKTGFSNTLVLRRVSKPLYSATARRNSISLQRRTVDGYGRPAAPRRTVGSRRTVSATFTTSTEGWTACLIARASLAFSLYFAVAFRGRCFGRNSAADRG